MRALVGDTALAPTEDGAERLRNAIALVATPPAPLPVSRSPLGASISGRTYNVEANSLGLQRLSITFTEDSGAVTRLALRDRTLLLPVGLDGRYRIADQAIAASILVRVAPGKPRRCLSWSSISLARSTTTPWE